MKVGVSWRGVSVGEGSAGEGGQWGRGVSGAGLGGRGRGASMIWIDRQNKEKKVDRSVKGIIDREIS